MATPAAPPAAAAAPPPGNPGDITKPVQNIDELKARISHKDVGGKPWHQPLLNPFQDPVRCLLGYCCGPCMHGMTVAEVEGDDNWIVPCLIFYVTSGFCVGWYFGQPNRSKIRQKYGLEEAPYSDCITWTGLCCFAVCQESAEIEFQKKNGGGASKPAAPAPPPATTAAPPVQSI